MSEVEKEFDKKDFVAGYMVYVAMAKWLLDENKYAFHGIISKGKILFIRKYYRLLIFVQIVVANTLKVDV